MQNILIFYAKLSHFLRKIVSFFTQSPVPATILDDFKILAMRKSISTAIPFVKHFIFMLH